MTSLVLDFESTMPGVDIRHDGLDNYVAKAEPLCLAYALDDGLIELIDFTDRPAYLFPHLATMIRNPNVTKIAHNISFERAFLRKLGLDTPLDEWIDTSVMSRYAGLPSKLADVCKALKLGDLGKHEDGTRLIKKFCVPKKDGTYRSRTSDPADWQKFLDYCKGDVTAEREVFRRLKAFQLPPREKLLWKLDEKINRRGLPVDMNYVVSASRQAATKKQEIKQELRALTGLENPNSREQFLGWAKARGYEFNSLGKAFVARMEKLLEEDERVDEMQT